MLTMLFLIGLIGGLVVGIIKAIIEFCKWLGRNGGNIVRAGFFAGYGVLAAIGIIVACILTFIAFIVLIALIILI